MEGTGHWTEASADTAGLSPHGLYVSLVNTADLTAHSGRLVRLWVHGRHVLTGPVTNDKKKHSVKCEYQSPKHIPWKQCRGPVI